MKFTHIALALALVFALSSPLVFAHGHHHHRHHHMSRAGGPNGSAGGPTTLSGTGSSQFGGSLPGNTGKN
jgi:hypothetical protein